MPSILLSFLNGLFYLTLVTLFMSLLNNREVFMEVKNYWGTWQSDVSVCKLHLYVKRTHQNLTVDISDAVKYKLIH